MKTPEMEAFDEDISCWPKYFQISHPLHIVQLWVPVLIVIYFKKVLWWGPSDTPIYVYNNMILEIILLLCAFNRLIVAYLSLGSMAYLLSSLATIVCQVCIAVHKMSLKSNKKKLLVFL